MNPKRERQRVTAEITVFHLTQFTRATGASLSAEEAMAFLNEGGRAYEMWKQMMRAGEEYIKNTLQMSEAQKCSTRSRDPSLAEAPSVAQAYVI